MTPGNAPRLQILLVEDNPGDVRLTREALSEAKLLVDLHVVNDGEAAMAFLHRLDPGHNLRFDVRPRFPAFSHRFAVVPRQGREAADLRQSERVPHISGERVSPGNLFPKLRFFDHANRLGPN